MKNTANVEYVGSVTISRLITLMDPGHKPRAEGKGEGSRDRSGPCLLSGPNKSSPGTLISYVPCPDLYHSFGNAFFIGKPTNTMINEKLI